LRVCWIATLSCLWTVCATRPLFPYSILTHEAIIDSEWVDDIEPLLRARFPSATPEQLHEAHAYAYGGAVIQDLGYYPFRSRFFSHLTHYVRTGDFVEALFEESKNLDDYAFALGALSHYLADIEGHSIAVNRSVALLYPRLHQRYGDWITWEESPWAHVLTEFGFDTLEVVARHNAPQPFRDWIGFRVAKPPLERAFKRTYGLELGSEFADVDVCLAAYRRVANKFLPEMTEVAWTLRSKELEERASGVHHQQLYHLSRKCYADWEKTYTKPGAGDKVTAFFFRLLPKFGPLSAFDFHTPTIQTEQLFADSLKATISAYDKKLQAVQALNYGLPDIDLDTGRLSHPGEYVHCDEAYAQLLHKLKGQHFAGVTSDLRGNLLSFYADSEDDTFRNQPEKWRKVSAELAKLKASTPAKPQASRGNEGGNQFAPAAASFR
jgi:hypothetical protein